MIQVGKWSRIYHYQDQGIIDPIGDNFGMFMQFSDV